MNESHKRCSEAFAPFKHTSIQVKHRSHAEDKKWIIAYRPRRPVGSLTLHCLKFGQICPVKPRREQNKAQSRLKCVNLYNSSVCDDRTGRLISNSCQWYPGGLSIKQVERPPGSSRDSRSCQSHNTGRLARRATEHSVPIRNGARE